MHRHHQYPRRLQGPSRLQAPSARMPSTHTFPPPTRPCPPTCPALSMPQTFDNAPPHTHSCCPNRLTPTPSLSPCHPPHTPPPPAHHRCVGAEWVPVLPGQSKITDLELPAVAVQQVAGLQVPVNNPSVVQEGDTLQQLLHQTLDLTDAELLRLQAAEWRVARRACAGGGRGRRGHKGCGGSIKQQARSAHAVCAVTHKARYCDLQPGCMAPCLPASLAHVPSLA